MGHPKRFFIKNLSEANPIIEGEEFYHLNKVLRLKTNEVVKLIDGCGRSLKARIVCIFKDRAILEPLSQIIVSPPPKIKTTIIVGASEPQSLEEALLHSTELGVSRFCIAQSKFSSVKIEKLAVKRSRFEKIAISAIKQSQNDYLPEIIFYENVEEAIKENKGNGFLFTLDTEDYFIKSNKVSGKIVLAIGPEGDFSEEEKSLFFENGFKKVKLCETILRVETAVVAALSQSKIFE